MKTVTELINFGQSNFGILTSLSVCNSILIATSVWGLTKCLEVNSIYGLSCIQTVKWEPRNWNTQCNCELQNPMTDKSSENQASIFNLHSKCIPFLCVCVWGGGGSQDWWLSRRSYRRYTSNCSAWDWTLDLSQLKTARKGKQFFRNRNTFQRNK
jgi:hypothetical protein